MRRALDSRQGVLDALKPYFETVLLDLEGRPS